MQEIESQTKPKPRFGFGSAIGFIIGILGIIGLGLQYWRAVNDEATRSLRLVKELGISLPFVGIVPDGKSQEALSVKLEERPANPLALKIQGRLEIDQRALTFLGHESSDPEIHLEVFNAIGPSVVSAAASSWMTELQILDPNLPVQISFEARSKDMSLQSPGPNKQQFFGAGTQLAEPIRVVTLDRLPDAMQDRAETLRERLSNFECYRVATSNRLPIVKTVAECWRSADPSARAAAANDGGSLVEIQRQMLAPAFKKGGVDQRLAQLDFAQTLLSIGRFCDASDVYRAVEHTGEKASNGKLLLTPAENQSFAAKIQCARGQRLQIEKTKICLVEGRFLEDTLKNRAAGRADSRGYYPQAIRAWLDAVLCAGGNLDKRQAIEAVVGMGAEKNIRALIVAGARQYSVLTTAKTSTTDQLVDALHKLDKALTM